MKTNRGNNNTKMSLPKTKSTKPQNLKVLTSSMNTGGCSGKNMNYKKSGRGK